jgi:hypothetical protein
MAHTQWPHQSAARPANRLPGMRNIGIEVDLFTK